MVDNIKLFIDACGEHPNLSIVKTHFKNMTVRIDILLQAIDEALLYNNSEILDYFNLDEQGFYWKSCFLTRSIRNGSIKQFEYIIKDENEKESFSRLLPFRKKFFNIISQNVKCFDLLYYIYKMFPSVKEHYYNDCLTFIYNAEAEKNR